jgi:hypothetical protein
VNLAERAVYAAARVVIATVLVAAALAAQVLAAAPVAALDDCAGVTVVVDAIELGGTVTARCVDDASDGLDALGRAGHDYTFLPGNPGFVCTIDQRPDPCNGAPTDAYWSYWVEGDDGWTYATLGAGSRRPAAGSVEGWRFGDSSSPPRIESASPDAGTTARGSAHAVAASPDAATSRMTGLAVAATIALLLVAGILVRQRR